MTELHRKKITTSSRHRDRGGFPASPPDDAEIEYISEQGTSPVYVYYTRTGDTDD